MSRPALVRPSQRKHADQAEAPVQVPPPTLHPLERSRLSSARGVLLGVALGLLIWIVAGVLVYWLF